MNKNIISGTVCIEYDASRCDIFLSAYANITRSKAQEIIDSGNFTVNGKIVKKNYKLSSGDTFTYIPPEPELTDAEPENIEIEIVYEDEYLAVVNKPKGMVVHPAAGNKSGTMVNALLYKLDGLSTVGGTIRPGIVHRIDKNTSGLLIVAKNDDVHIKLAKQIESHSFEREYRGIVVGTPKDATGTINAPIGRSTRDRKKMAVTEQNSKNAVTHYEVLQSYGKYSFMRFKLETGRTHQIRVHLSHIGHPILGDDVYGGARKEFEELQGQCLHAYSIGFIHPITGEKLYFESKLPDYFINTLKKIENRYGVIKDE